MSNRLNKEREQQLQPNRIKFAVEQIEGLGLKVHHQDNTKIQFLFKGNTINFFPYSGWHSGKGIKDGRGLANLLEQLKEKK